MNDLDIFNEVMGFSPEVTTQVEEPEELIIPSVGSDEDIFSEVMGFAPPKRAEVEAPVIEPPPEEPLEAPAPEMPEVTEPGTPEITAPETRAPTSTMEFTEPTEIKPTGLTEKYVPPSPTPAYGTFGVQMAPPPAVSPQEKAAAYVHRALAAGKKLIAPEVEKTAFLQPDQEKREERAKAAVELPKESIIHGKAAEYLDPTWYTSEKISERIERIKGQDPNLANSFLMGDITGAADINVANAFMSGDATAKNIALETQRSARQAAGEFQKKRENRKGFTGNAENVLEAVSAMLPMMGKGAAQGAIPVVGPLISSSMWAKQGAGDIITELKDKGADDDTALAYGLAGGLAYALVEQVQVGRVLNPQVKKAVGNSVKKKIAAIAKEKGIDWFKNVREEVIQGLVTENAIVSALKESGIEVDSQEVKDRYKKAIKENFTGSAWPMAVLSAVGLSGGAARVAYAERGKSKAAAETGPVLETGPVPETGPVLETEPVPETGPVAPPTAPPTEYATLADYDMDVEEFNSLPEDVQYDIAKELSPQEREKILAQEKPVEQITLEPKEAEVGLQREAEAEIKEAELPGVETVTEPVEKEPVPVPEVTPKEETEIRKEVESIPREDKTEKEEIKQVDVAPSEAQKEAGNYRKAHIKRDGFEISIENPAGSKRSGTDPAGKKWSQKINHDYGYIRGTKGADAFREAGSTDQVDVFIKPNSTEGGTVYVVNQVDPTSGKFDEHKVMIGFDSQEEAEKAYLSNYEKDWKGLGSTVEMPMDAFKEWVYTDATKQPVKPKEVPSAEEVRETARETGKEKRPVRREEGRIRVRDDEKGRVEARARKEIRTPRGVTAKEITLPKPVNETSPNYEPVLDLNKITTGWLRPKNNHSVIVDPKTGRQITFVADKPEAATATALTNTAAHSHAVSNPLIKKGKYMETATQRVRKRLKLEEESILKEETRGPGKADREAPVSPAVVTEGEIPAAKAKEKKKEVAREEKPVRQRLEAQQKRGRTVRAKSRRPASVKRVAEEKDYTPEYWKAQHGHHLNVEVYNALRDGWTDRAQTDHPGRQKGWVDDYNLITDSNVPGGTKNPTLSDNAKQWLQEVVDNIAENPDYIQELNKIGISEPQHIDDVIAILQGSMSAAEFTRFHNDYERNIREADVDLDQYDEALRVFNEEPYNLTPEQRAILEKTWNATVEDVAAGERGELKPDDWRQQDLFGKEKSVAQLEAEEKTRAEKEEIARKTEERKGGEPSIAGLPMFEDQDIEGSQQTIKFEKKQKEKPKFAKGKMTLDTAKEYAVKYGLEYQGFDENTGDRIFRETRTGTEFRANSQEEITRAISDIGSGIAPAKTVKTGKGVKFAKAEKEPVTVKPAERKVTKEEKELTDIVYSSVDKPPKYGTIQIVTDIAPGSDIDAIGKTIEETTDKKVVFIKTDDRSLKPTLGFTVDGLSIPGETEGTFKDTIFVNVDSTRPIMWTAYHEFAHFLETNPNYKKRFWGAVKLTDRGMAEFAKEGESEFTADIIGEMMSRQDFWKNLAKQGRTPFQKVMQEFLRIINKIRRIIASNNLPQYENLLVDVTTTRDEIARIYSDYRKMTGKEVGNIPAKMVTAIKKEKAVFAKQKPAKPQLPKRKIGLLPGKKKEQLNLSNIPGASKEGIEAQKIFEQQNAAVRNKFNRSLDERLKAVKYFLGEKIWDRVYYAKNMLGKSIEAKQVVGKVNASKGSSANSKMIYETAEEKITENLPFHLEEALANYIEAKRIVEIEKIKGEGKVRHTGGMTKQQAEAFVFDIENKIDKRDSLAIKIAAGRYWNTMHDQLKGLRDNGIISDELYKKLSSEGKHYSPRRFLQHIDPAKSISTPSGQKLSVRESGIQALAEGSEEAMVNNWRLLLSDVVSRTQSRIFKNEAAKSLGKFVENNPNNLFGGEIEQKKQPKLPRGSERIYFIEDGETKSIIVSEKFADSWNQNDVQINRTTAKFLNTILGGALVRPFATGIFAPEFALSNIPRDMALQWIATQEYSKAAPVAIIQNLDNFRRVFKDAWHGTGRYEEYVKQGGGMEFLNEQGTAFRKDPTKAVSPTSIRNKRIMDSMRKLQEFSERLTRLALREQAIKNGKTPQEATVIAREYLDFAQGGSLTKALDNAVPYLNASVQGARSVVEAAVDDPATFSIKAAQLITMGAALALTAIKFRREEWDEISDREKVGRWNFPLGFSYKNKYGEENHIYFSIPKDQSSRIFATIGETIIERMQGSIDGETAWKRIRMAFDDMSPIDTIGMLPPTLSALIGYALNINFWKEDKIWKGREVSPYKEVYEGRTPEFYADLAKGLNEIEIDLSPERMHQSLQQVMPRSLLTSLMGGAYESVTAALSKEDKEKLDKMTYEHWSKLPGVRKYFRATYPSKTDYQKVFEQAVDYGIPLKTKKGKRKSEAQIKHEIEKKEQQKNDIRQEHDNEAGIVSELLLTGKNEDALKRWLQLKEEAAKTMGRKEVDRINKRIIKRIEKNDNKKIYRTLFK